MKYMTPEQLQEISEEIKDAASELAQISIALDEYRESEVTDSLKYAYAVYKKVREAERKIDLTLDGIESKLILSVVYGGTK